MHLFMQYFPNYSSYSTLDSLKPFWCYCFCNPLPLLVVMLPPVYVINNINAAPGVGCDPFAGAVVPPVVPEMELLLLLLLLLFWW